MNIKRLMEIGCYRGMRHRREPAGARPADAHQRPDAQGPAQGRGREEEDGLADSGSEADGTEDTTTVDASADPKARRASKKASADPPRRRRSRSAARSAWSTTASRTSRRRSTTRSSRSPTPRGNVVAWSSAGGIGFKGSRKGTPFAATQAAIDGGQRRQDLRHALGRGAGEGPGLRPRVGDPRAADRRDRGEVDPRRHADSAQRLPAAEARASDAVDSTADWSVAIGRRPELTGVGSWIGLTEAHEWLDTSDRFAGCAAARHEALPQGRALLHREVRDREAQLPARPARQVAQGEDRRLRHAAAREAEGQAHLRRARGPVPPVLRGGGADARHHRRDAAAAAGAPARQRRLPLGFATSRAAGAPARPPWPLPR